MDTRIGIENDNRTFKSSRRDSSPPLHILYYDISGFNSSTQFLLCCTGVLVFYLIYGYLQVCLSLNFMLINCIFSFHVLRDTIFNCCQRNLIGLTVTKTAWLLTPHARKIICVGAYFVCWSRGQLNCYFGLFERYLFIWLPKVLWASAKDGHIYGIAEFHPFSI